MRKLILAVSGLVLGAGAAHAADLARPVPSYAPAPIRAAYDWSGFYLGANLGGAWSRSRHEYVVNGVAVVSDKSGHSGVIGGMQAGYNWQTGPLVLGIETDIQATGVKGNIGTLTGGGVTVSADEKLPWFGTIRGRAGYAADNWMFYVTGGYAYGRVKNTTTWTDGVSTASLTANHTRSGWTLGTGLEWAFARNWSAKVEYLYVDLGKNTINYAAVGLPGLVETNRVHNNILRVGVNYQF